MGDYLKRFGFTPQKPLKRAYEQNPKAVQRWLDEEYPAIAKRAKEEGAEIHWGDETGLRNDSQHGRSYAPRGKTPAIRLSAKRQRINLISSITNQGKVRFMTYQEKMHADILIRFMTRLIKDADQKIFPGAGQSARPSQQKGQSLAGRSSRPDRSLLPAVLLTRDEPRRVSQLRSQSRRPFTPANSG